MVGVSRDEWKAEDVKLIKVAWYRRKLRRSWKCFLSLPEAELFSKPSQTPSPSPHSTKSKGQSWKTFGNANVRSLGVDSTRQHYPMAGKLSITKVNSISKVEPDTERSAKTKIRVGAKPQEFMPSMTWIRYLKSSRFILIGEKRKSI